MPRRLLAAIAVAALLPSSTARSAPAASDRVDQLPESPACPDPGPTAPAQAQLRVMACLVNSVRRAHGLRAMTWSPLLVRTGTLRLADDVRCGDFSHVPCGLGLLTVLGETGYLRGANSYRVGENLAWGQGALGSPSEILASWLVSGPHRHNLLDPAFREFGLALGRPAAFQGRPDVTLWVAEFGSRR